MPRLGVPNRRPACGHAIPLGAWRCAATSTSARTCRQAGRHRSISSAKSRRNWVPACFSMRTASLLFSLVSCRHCMWQSTAISIDRLFPGDSWPGGAVRVCALQLPGEVAGQLDPTVPQPARLRARHQPLRSSGLLPGTGHGRSSIKKTRTSRPGRNNTSQTSQMSCCRDLGPVRSLAMYQVARAGLRICMSRAHKRRTRVSGDMARPGQARLGPGHRTAGAPAVRPGRRRTTRRRSTTRRRRQLAEQHA